MLDEGDDTPSWGVVSVEALLLLLVEEPVRNGSESSGVDARRPSILVGRGKKADKRLLA